MEAPTLKLLVYVLAAFLIIAAGFMVATYQSPVSVISEEHASIERSPRLIELLGKPSLSLAESEELNRELYAHHRKLNPSSGLGFEEWKAKYIRVKGQ